jgi:hypothetical protein
MPGIPAPPQVWPAGQEPQFSMPPQPSSLRPHNSFKLAQVAGVHIGAPQIPGRPPPPQVCDGGHMPQLTVPPQPSPWMPQL